MTRDQFIYALTACGCLLKDGKTWYEHNELIECFENLGLFEQEPRKGHWIVNKKIDTAYDISGYKSWATKYMCNHCGFIHQAIEDHGVYSYCPNCGAKMESEADNGNDD